jgi:hypothetical protein
MASKYMKAYSTFLVIKEMQIKTTLGYYLTPVRMVRIDGNSNNKYWQGMWQNRNTYILLVGMQISTTTMESSMEILQKN